MGMKSAKEVMAEFKNKQELIKCNRNNKQKEISKGFNKKRQNINTTTNFYLKYKNKLSKGQLDKFNSRDLMYFFKDKAEEVGVRYVIANPRKDMHQYNLMKKKGYSIEDILLMIEFLFLSEQDYLDKENITPNVLVSGWCNTIYADSQKWLNDEYIPKNQKKFLHREWNSHKEENRETKIGEWDF